MRILALVAAIALVAPVQAIGAPGCPLVVDARGDATPVFYGTPTPADEAAGARATDIVSANAWADDERVHVTIRVTELPPLGVPRGHGHQWAVDLRAEGGMLDLHTIENNDTWSTVAVWVPIVGNDDAGAGAGVGLKGATGTHDVSQGVVRMSVPLSAVARYTKAGKGVRWLPRAWTFIEVGNPAVRAPGGYASVGSGGMGSPSDRADGSRPVRVGSPECAG
jgi:hypothetical protein